jgi:HTH-type transcriptional regulator / antitoxin HipB
LALSIALSLVRQTLTKLYDLQQKLSALESDRQLADRSHPRAVKMQTEALSIQIQAMLAELSEYKSLKQGTGKIAISSLEELPVALIKARIAAGITQKELAQRVAIQEQQIQRYEANRYAVVGFERLLELFRSLGVKLMDLAKLIIE